MQKDNQEQTVQTVNISIGSNKKKKRSEECDPETHNPVTITNKIYPPLYATLPLTPLLYKSQQTLTLFKVRDYVEGVEEKTNSVEHSSNTHQDFKVELRKIQNKSNPANNKIRLGFWREIPGADPNTKQPQQQDQSKACQNPPPINNVSLYLTSLHFLFSPSLPHLPSDAYFYIPGTNKNEGGGVESFKGVNQVETEYGVSGLMFKKQDPLSLPNLSASCPDPLKMGGWITGDRKTGNNKEQYPENKKADGSDYEQYAWAAQNKTPHSFLPHDRHDKGNYCGKQAVDPTLVKIMKGEEYGEEEGEKKEGVRGRRAAEKKEGGTPIKIPDGLNEPFKKWLQNDGSQKNQTQSNGVARTDSSSEQDNEVESTSPSQKNTGKTLLQSDFRPYANVFGTHSGFNPKSMNAFNPTLERTLVQYRWMGEDLEVPSELQDKKDKLVLSPSISLYLTLYDPLSSFLYTLRYWDSFLFPLSSFSPSISRLKGGTQYLDFGRRWGDMWEWQGYTDSSTNQKKDNRRYGLSGLLSLTPRLVRKIDGKYHLSLEIKTQGFMNTRNPTCDPRHIIGQDLLAGTKKKEGSSDNDTSQKCTTQSGWSYNPHLHLPTFLFISLDPDNTRGEWYEDEQGLFGTNKGGTRMSSSRGGEGETTPQSSDSPSSPSQQTSTLPVYPIPGLESEVGIPEMSAYVSWYKSKNTSKNISSETLDYEGGRVITTSGSSKPYASLHLPSTKTPPQLIEVGRFWEEYGIENEEQKKATTLRILLTGSSLSSHTLLPLPWAREYTYIRGCVRDTTSSSGSGSGRGRRDEEKTTDNDTCGFDEGLGNSENKDSSGSTTTQSQPQNQSSKLKKLDFGIKEKDGESTTATTKSYQGLTFSQLAPSHLAHSQWVEVRMGDWIGESGKEENGSSDKTTELHFRSVVGVGAETDGKKESAKNGTNDEKIKKLVEEMDKFGWEEKEGEGENGKKSSDDDKLNITSSTGPSHTLLLLRYTLLLQWKSATNTMHVTPRLYGMSYVAYSAKANYSDVRGLRGGEGIKKLKI